MKLFAMTFAICAIFVLPFDVWNTTQRGELDNALPIIWQILFAVIIVLVLVVIPFTFFYFESWDPEITYVFFLKIQILITNFFILFRFISLVFFSNLFFRLTKTNLTQVH